MKLDKFITAKKASNMDTYLKLFLEDNTNEAYAT